MALEYNKAAAQQNGNGVNVTYQAGEDVTSMLADQAGSINSGMEALANSVASLEATAAQLTRPRRLVRDDMGRPVASEIVPETPE